MKIDSLTEAVAGIADRVAKGHIADAMDEVEDIAKKAARAEAAARADAANLGLLDRSDLASINRVLEGLSVRLAAIEVQTDPAFGPDAKTPGTDAASHPVGTVVKDSGGDLWTKYPQGWGMTADSGGQPWELLAAKLGPLTVQRPAEPDEVTIEPGMWITSHNHPDDQLLVIGYDSNNWLAVESPHGNTIRLAAADGLAVILPAPSTRTIKPFTAKVAR